ncbi:hypothetical protein HYX70_03690 [Candidatus Saccharibacteria bacterium]|nr:hypothetical protein [Candidatus Saccharibacteria bacterium]
MTGAAENKPDYWRLYYAFGWTVAIVFGGFGLGAIIGDIIDDPGSLWTLLPLTVVVVAFVIFHAVFYARHPLRPAEDNTEKN